jgi:Fe2+ or Zn2+ uptake regulation protein
MADTEIAELFYELEAGGHKLTPLRRALIEIFGRQQRPLLLEELGKILQRTLIRVHRATLYRELDFLEGKQIIRPVFLEDGKQRYEFSDRDHHHHLVCTRCKRIEDVELKDDESELNKLLKTKIDFQITHHTLEFFGLCGECK